jgi:predicted O-methyltransferase YrrM
MSTPDQWTAVDQYFADVMLPADSVLDAVLAESEKAGLPPIAVSPTQGKFLNLLARVAGARTVLEIGTLGGYSTIWLARALPKGGKVVTLEFDPKHAEVARTNFSPAGLSDTIDIRLGRAIDTLPRRKNESPQPHSRRSVLRVMTVLRCSS